MMQTFAKIINVPDYPPREKHPTIMNGFDELKSGEFMQLVNDHDPKPLQYQFMMERMDQFTWEYLRLEKNKVNQRFSIVDVRIIPVPDEEDRLQFERD